MTADELLALEDIRHTMAGYTMAGDRSEGVPEQDLFHYRGREEIREWITRWGRTPQEGTMSSPRATFCARTCPAQRGLGRRSGPRHRGLAALRSDQRAQLRRAPEGKLQFLEGRGGSGQPLRNSSHPGDEQLN